MCVCVCVCVCWESGVHMYAIVSMRFWHTFMTCMQPGPSVGYHITFHNDMLLDLSWVLNYGGNMHASPIFLAQIAAHHHTIVAPSHSSQHHYTHRSTITLIAAPSHSLLATKLIVINLKCSQVQQYETRIKTGDREEAGRNASPCDYEMH